MSGRGPPDITNLHSVKIDNLAPEVTDRDLRPLFESFGKIGDIHVPRSRYSSDNRGFAFVRFYDKYEAEDAQKDMDGRTLLGREMKIQLAKYDRKHPSSFAPRGGCGGSRGRDRDYDDRDRGRGRSRSRSPPRRRSRSPPRRRSPSPRRRSPSPRRRSPSPRRRSPSPRRRSPSPRRRSPSPRRRSPSPPRDRSPPPRPRDDPPPQPI